MVAGIGGLQPPPESQDLAENRREGFIVQGDALRPGHD